MKNLLLLASLALPGCFYVVTPHIVTQYDEECRIFFREMELDVEQQEVLPPHGYCSGEEDCLGLLATIAMITPVSAIISGSIVVVGNTVFWMEKQGLCLVKEANEAGAQ